MHLLRSATPRATSARSTAQVARSLRSFRLHPSQKAVQSRTYASPFDVPKVKTSDVPWLAGAGIAALGGLYYAINHDLSPPQNPNAKAKLHNSTTNLHTENDPPFGGEPEIHSQNSTRKDKMGENRINNKRDDPRKAGAGRPDPDDEAGLVGHSAKDLPKAMESGTKPPDVSDKPDPRGKPKSHNEMSGKQEGLSNADTHHTSQISKQPEKSKKGEGVAETAKLKGTVSTNRPGAENKEERGKAQMEEE